MSGIGRWFAPSLPPDAIVIGDGSWESFHFLKQNGGWQLAGNRAGECPAEHWSEQVWGRSPSGSEAVEPWVAAMRRATGRKLTAISLVLPDAWMRMFVVDLGDEPGSTAQIDQLLAWKLKKLLPFRIEELRFVWTPIPSPSGRPRRFFVVGMVEKVAVGLERAFDACGVWVGRMEPRALALARLAGSAERLLLVDGDAAEVRLLALDRGVPTLFRLRRLAHEDDASEVVRRELDLTVAYLVAADAAPVAIVVADIDPAPWADAIGAASELSLRRLALPPTLAVGGVPPDVSRRAMAASGCFVAPRLA